MAKIILDSSVIVKLYSEEEQKEVIPLLKKWQDKEFSVIVPEIALYELMNALSLGKKLSVNKVFESLLIFWEMVEETISLNQELAKRTLYFVSKKLSVYDAVFIALAEYYDFPLITADYKHHQKSLSSKIKFLKEV